MARAQGSARLGVVISDLTVTQASELGWANGGGAYVNNVVDETAAARAGILPDDLIVEIDGRSIKGIDEFTCLLASRMPGELVRLTLVRNKQVQIRNITLGQWHNDPAMARFFTQNCGVSDVKHGSSYSGGVA